MNSVRLRKIHIVGKNYRTVCGSVIEEVESFEEPNFSILSDPEICLKCKKIFGINPPIFKK